MQQGFARFPGELGKDEVVGFAEQGGELFFRQGVLRFQRNPLRAGHVRCGNDTGAFGEVGEVFSGTLERKPDFRRFQNGHGKNLSVDSEGEVSAPGDLLGCMWERKAQIADPVDVQVHRQEFRGNLVLLRRFLNGPSA